MDSKKIRHILVRHEQGAGHAAEGYASSSGKLGVCIATSRSRSYQPGYRNRGCSHGLGSTVAITGQVNFSHLMGTDAFQEADIVGITMPITKHSFLVTKA
jgi:acetolactate synthase I/II/III large subunit